MSTGIHAGLLAVTLEFASKVYAFPTVAGVAGTQAVHANALEGTLHLTHLPDNNDLIATVMRLLLPVMYFGAGVILLVFFNFLYSKISPGNSYFQIDDKNDNKHSQQPGDVYKTVDVTQIKANRDGENSNLKVAMLNIDGVTVEEPPTEEFKVKVTKRSISIREDGGLTVNVKCPACGSKNSFPLDSDVYTRGPQFYEIASEKLRSVTCAKSKCATPFKLWISKRPIVLKIDHIARAKQAEQGRKRGELVKNIMKERGVTLPEASKIIKAENLMMD